MALDQRQAQTLIDFVTSPSNVKWNDVRNFMRTQLDCTGNCAGVYAEACEEFAEELLKPLNGDQLEKVYSFITKRKIMESPHLKEKLTPKLLEKMVAFADYPIVASILF